MISLINLPTFITKALRTRAIFNQESSNDRIYSEMIYGS